MTNPPQQTTHKSRNLLVTCGHTILFAAYPVLAMLAFNIGEIPVSDALRVLVVSLIAAILLLLVLRLILRDWVKASLISTGALILFFSYGHIYDLVRQYNLAEVILGKHKFLLPLWVIIFGIWIWWVVKKLKKTREAVQFFNILGVVLLLLPLYT